MENKFSCWQTGKMKNLLLNNTVDSVRESPLSQYLPSCSGSAMWEQNVCITTCDKRGSQHREDRGLETGSVWSFVASVGQEETLESHLSTSGLLLNDSNRPIGLPRWREWHLASPLDCKEVQPVHPKGDQSCAHWKDWCWSWNSYTLATSCEELNTTNHQGNVNQNHSETSPHTF